jgi:hypothetical protein
MPTEEQTYRVGVLEKLDDLSHKIDALDVKVTYTNGKVKKITIVLIAMGFFCLGLGLSNPELIKLLVALI